MPTPLHDQKLESLLAGAARVFALRGYHDTSMRDLARETGVSLSGIYYYVPGKEELLALIQTRHFGAVLERARSRLEGVEDAAARLAIFVENHLEYFGSHPAEMKVLSHETATLSGARLLEVTALRRAYLGELMQILAALEREHGPAPAERRIAAHSLFGMMNAIHAWYDPRGGLGMPEIGRQLSRLFLGGYAAGALSAAQRG